MEGGLGKESQMLTSPAIDKEPSSCCAVQAGVADKAGVLWSVADVRWVDNDDLTTCHALANIVIGLSDQLGVDSSDEPRTK